MSYENVTFLVCNARCRSAWLAEVLSHFAVASIHDPLRFCGSIAEDFKSYVDDLCAEAGLKRQRVFVADSGAAAFLPSIIRNFPGARYLFVWRNPDDVDKSLQRLKMHPRFSAQEINDHMVRVLDQMRKTEIQYTCVMYDELETFQGCQHVIRFASGWDLPRYMFERFDSLNIQSMPDKHMRNVDVFTIEQLMKESSL